MRYLGIWTSKDRQHRECRFTFRGSGALEVCYVLCASVSFPPRSLQTTRPLACSYESGPGLETRSTGFIITAGAGRKTKVRKHPVPLLPCRRSPPPPVLHRGETAVKSTATSSRDNPGQIGALTAVRHGPFWTTRLMTDHRMAIITQLHATGRWLPSVGLSRPNMLEGRSPNLTHAPLLPLSRDRNEASTQPEKRWW